MWLARSLASRDQDAIVRALRRPAERGLQGEGLHAVAKLLKDPRGKVSASASSALRSLAARPRPREQVRAFYCSAYAAIVDLFTSCQTAGRKKAEFIPMNHVCPSSLACKTNQSQRIFKIFCLK